MPFGDEATLLDSRRSLVESHREHVLDQPERCVLVIELRHLASAARLQHSRSSSIYARPNILKNSEEILCGLLQGHVLCQISVLRCYMLTEPLNGVQKAESGGCASQRISKRLEEFYSPFRMVNASPPRNLFRVHKVQEVPKSSDDRCVDWMLSVQSCFFHFQTGGQSGGCASICKWERCRNRTALVCPICRKVPFILSTHLRRACMRDVPAEEVKETLLNVRKRFQQYAKLRVVKYRDIKKFIIPDKTSRCLQFFEDKRVVITNKPTLPRDQSETAAANPSLEQCRVLPSSMCHSVGNASSSRAPVTSETSSRQDVHETDSPSGVSGGTSPSRSPAEGNLSTPVSGESELDEGCRTEDIPEDDHLYRSLSTKWTNETRNKMKAAGLYKRHSLNAPVLQDFSNYLQKTLGIQRSKQEVESVARFLYYMNPKGISLNFVKDIGKVQKFFVTLKRFLKTQTVYNYLKHIRRFVTYQMKGTNLSLKNPHLFQKCGFFMQVTSEIQKRFSKDISCEVVCQRFQSLITGIKTPAECRQLLEVSKGSFHKALEAAENGEELDASSKLDIIYYLEAVLVLKHLQRPGVVRNMTVYEWEKRMHHQYVTPERTANFAIVGVRLHKTATHQVAAFALTEEEEKWFSIYFETVRPTLLSENSPEDAFFVSTSGRKMYNVSNDLRRQHERYKLPNVTSQAVRRACESWTMQEYSDAERYTFAKYLTHTNLTADRCYREETVSSICRASLLVAEVGVMPSDRAESPSRESLERASAPPRPQTRKSLRIQGLTNGTGRSRLKLP